MLRFRVWELEGLRKATDRNYFMNWGYIGTARGMHASIPYYQISKQQVEDLLVVDLPGFVSGFLSPKPESLDIQGLSQVQFKGKAHESVGPQKELCDPKRSQLEATCCISRLLRLMDKIPHDWLLNLWLF